MRGAGILAAEHGCLIRNTDKQSWEKLRDISKRATSYLWRPIPEKFTNVAILNAMSLLFLGQAFKWKQVEREGLERLKRIAIYTFEWGVHEYYSSAYTAIQIQSLAAIHRLILQKGNSIANQASELAWDLLRYYYAFAGLVTMSRQETTSSFSAQVGIARFTTYLMCSPTIGVTLSPQLSGTGLRYAITMTRFSRCVNLPG